MNDDQKERRAGPRGLPLEARTAGDGFSLVGYGAAFAKRSQPLGGFVEEVRAGAFTKTLGDNPDVRALFNHDPNFPLGRTRVPDGMPPTLRLWQDETGLGYDITLPDTTYARDLFESVQRGDITQSSFGFYVQDDEWSQTPDGMPLRTLTQVSLHNGDVSPVTYPAYEDTVVGARALRMIEAQQNAPKVSAPEVDAGEVSEEREEGQPSSVLIPVSLLAKQLELKARLRV